MPDYDVQDEGIVVVLITVNRNGIVTNAITGSKGTTTFNKNLLLKAKQAALKTRFSVNNNAPISQQGKIIYNFKLNWWTIKRQQNFSLIRFQCIRELAKSLTRKILEI